MRITDNLLLSVADTVDIVEPITKFTDKLKGKAGVGKIFNVGLEEWAPGESDVDCRYDLIWIQWCAGHLTDSQLIAFLERCTVVLKEDGWIVVKENLSTSGEDVFDELDSSVTRTDEKFRQLFTDAGMDLKKTEIQRGLPKELYPVRIYALQPKAAGSSEAP
ncbi:hypothetical protein DH86_00002328 [Scytalidium sp. 3C]|nr:hypothetical protein DH86_00002328 [Scytalidium sp. 3C]